MPGRTKETTYHKCAVARDATAQALQTSRLQQRMVWSLEELATMLLCMLMARSVTSPSWPRHDLSNRAVWLLQIYRSKLDGSRVDMSSRGVGITS